MKIVDVQRDANAAVWIRVIYDGAILGSSISQSGGLWFTLEAGATWHRTPIGEFLPTIGVYPRLKRIGITSGVNHGGGS